MCVIEMEIITNSKNNPYIFTSGENLVNVFKVTKISTLITFPLKLIKLVNKENQFNLNKKTYFALLVSCTTHLKHWLN